MPENMSTPPISTAVKTGISALSFAAVLFFFKPPLAAIPLAMFVLLCIAAPFFPGYSFFLSVISTGKKGEEAVALTFDDGPNPSSTPILLQLLAHHQLPATFFVVGEKAQKHPELIRAILAQGHTIGNHSWNHDYWLMLRSRNVLKADLQKTQETLLESGVRPHVFRPPVGITGPRLGQVLKEEDLITVTYSCRAFDRGNRNIANLANKIVTTLKPGHIIMLHDLPPYEEEQFDYWRNELDNLFCSLKKNYAIAPLEKIIGRPVSEIVEHLAE